MTDKKTIHHRHCIAYLAAAFISAAAFLLAGTDCFAAWEPSSDIRVGIFTLGNFQYFDENGEECGYNVEYLDKIAELKHWNYTYVKVNNWVEATSLLEKGEIDLLAPAQNIPSLSERFSYAAFPMGTEAAAVYVREDDSDIVYQDFERMKTLHYGGAENSTFTKNFITRFQDMGAEPDLTYYPDTSSLFHALDAGEVDAIVSNIMFNTEEYRLIDRFSPLPVYYISTKDNQDLLNELYEAMCTLELNDPSFETRLTAKFFPYYGNAEFTYDELEYIHSLPEIPVGYWSEGKPLAWQDEKTGELNGITRDLLDRVSEISGIKFTYVPLTDPDMSQEALKEKGVYAMCGINHSGDSASIPYVWLSSPYFTSERVLIGKEGMHFRLNGQMRIATPPYSASFEDELNQQYPNAQLEEYSDAAACFKAVSNGSADVLMQNRYVADPFLAKPSYQDMRVLPVQSTKESLCMATLHFPGDDTPIQKLLDDERFLSVIDKSIQRLTEDETNDIIIRRTAEAQYNYTLPDFIYQYRYLIALLSVSVIVFIIGAVKIQRMKDRENKILSNAIEQANRANMAKSQFLSNISHEIRTPLNAIVGMTALAQQTADNPPRTIQYLEKISDSSKLLMSIINDVLDMSAIESQKLRISNMSFDFKSLLSSISELYYTQCRQKGIRFEMQLEGVYRESLIGDSLRTNQILMNLLSNAYKFTESGGAITVTVSEKMDQRESQRVYVRFTVEDTGCGMSDEMQKRLFDAFEQESPDTALKHGGSGLGLAITKNLVDLMHGAISVKSKKGVGTTFTVDLPFETADDIISADPDKLKDLRVMVVDDDSYMCEYIGNVLAGMMVRYDVASSGSEALQKIEQAMQEKDPYNVCFLDWRMPGMDGVEAARRIREKISKDILTVIISAYDLSEIENDVKDAGIDQAVTKPLFQSSIYNILVSIHEKYPAAVSMREDHYDFKGKRILLAEDFELNREVAVDLLELVNLSVDCAHDGVEAVDMFVNSKPGTYEAVLMDIQMPNRDGYEAMKMIRESSHSQAKSIPIYAMTANAFAEDVAKSLSAGANGHIAKPIDSKALYKLLYKCIMKGDSR